MSVLYFFLCATVVGLCCLELCIGGNNETDRLALLDFKAKITEDPLNVTSSWNQTLHFCQWLGVTCGHRHKRVVILHLGSAKLTGSISPSLGNLSFLRQLHLSNNSFSGPIPSEIGRLHKLQILRLLNNSLGGEIPSNISGCHNLFVLNLGSNNLSGRIPPAIGSLIHLQLLSLHGNHLVGTIPPSLGNLSSLVHFYLGTNSLLGKIPESLGKLKQLYDFDLSFNMLSGEVSHTLFNLSSMQFLYCTNNQFEGSLPSDLGIRLPYLTEIALASNHFTGSIPDSISNSSNLEYIEVSDNNFEGQVPLLGNAPNIWGIDLSDNFLGYGETTDLDFVYSLANSSALQELDIYQNKFRGIFPQVVSNFSKLTFLGIGSNMIYGSIPTSLGNLVDLVSIYGHGAQLFGKIPASIGRLQNLEYLGLSFNQFSGHLPTAIGNLTKLSKLYLYGNNLQGEIPTTIGNCTNLLGLSLASNNLSGNIPSQIFSISALSIIFDLSDNRLTGIFPSQVGKMVHLVTINISQNMLTGEIPSTLDACVELETLDMAGNFFQGTIPSSLKALIALQELNLSHNNLSGKIPDFLTKFRLQELDLSYNNLEGEVPVGGIFNNTSGLSIVENHKLCGGIPILKLPQCKFNKPKRRRFTKKLRLIIAIVSLFSGIILLVGLTSLYVFYRRMGRKDLPALGGLDSSNTLPNLSYQSLLKATNGFASENSIGSGSFGVVYKASFDEGRTYVAIKKFNLDHRGASKSFMAECEVLRNIRHRNLVKVITACSGIDYKGNDFKALVYDYMVNGSLEDWLHPQASSTMPRNLNLIQRLGIAIDVASALEYLHHGFGDPIVHCDLKPSNVLLDDEMVAHVADFGLAKFLPNGTSSSHANQSSSIGIRGTIGYAPPEYGLGNGLSKEGDVYSFGILLLEMFIGKRPTNYMFKEGLSLHKFVKAALPEQVIDILDSALLDDITGVETITSDMNCEIHGSKIMLEALSSVLGIALSCSAEVQTERMDMRDVVAKLSSIRNKIAATRLTRRRAT